MVSLDDVVTLRHSRLTVAGTPLRRRPPLSHPAPLRAQVERLTPHERLRRRLASSPVGQGGRTGSPVSTARGTESTELVENDSSRPNGRPPRPEPRADPHLEAAKTAPESLAEARKKDRTMLGVQALKAL